MAMGILKAGVKGNRGELRRAADALSKAARSTADRFTLAAAEQALDPNAFAFPADRSEPEPSRRPELVYFSDQDIETLRQVRQRSVQDFEGQLSVLAKQKILLLKRRERFRGQDFLGLLRMRGKKAPAKLYRRRPQLPEDPDRLKRAMGRIQAELKSVREFLESPEGKKPLSVRRVAPELDDAAPAAGSVDFYLQQSAAYLSPREAFEPRDGMWPVLISNAVAKFGNSTGFEDEFRKENGQAPTRRDALVEAMNQDPWRDEIFNAALETLNQNSDATLKLFYRGKRPKFDIAFVGAGLAEQNMQNYLRLNKTGLSTITFERESVVVPNFANGGAAYNLNSPSRLENAVRLRQKFGDGDLNFLPGGLLQLSQITGERNPVADYFARALTINRAIANAPLLLGDAVVAARANTGPDKDLYPWTVKLQSGREADVWALIEAGTGDSKLPPIPNLVRLYERFKNAENAGPPTPLMLYPELNAFIKGSRNPMRPFSRKRVGIVGDGDSAKAAVRWLLGLSDPRAYGRDTARVPRPDAIVWYNQPFNDCESFTAGNRSFYSDIGLGFRSQRIIPKNRLVGVNYSQGVFTLQAQADRGLASRQTEEVVDFVIVATGFENRLLSRYAEAKPSGFRIVQGLEPELGTVGFARQLLGSEGAPLDIYAVGAAASEVVDPRELKQNEENSVANANHSWREWRLIEALALRRREILGGER